MTKERSVICVCLICTAAFVGGCSHAAVQKTDADARAGAPAGYQLVWADEFDDDGRPDPNHWTFEGGFVRNEELQWYQPDNASCKDGLLVIEARRERVPNPSYDPNGRTWRRNRQYAEYTEPRPKAAQPRQHEQRCS
jgi:beta-glucanase (GH16 family)